MEENLWVTERVYLAIENILANELDLPLSNIFISVGKQDGTEYEPCTLTL